MRPEAGHFGAHDGVASQKGKEKLNRVAEGAPFDRHDEVNGIEVAPAAEAAREVRGGVGGRVTLRALRAEEAEVALGHLVGEAEHVDDEGRDVDLVAEPPERRTGVAIWHGGIPYGRWNSAMVVLTSSALIRCASCVAALMRQAVATLLIWRGTPPV